MTTPTFEEIKAYERRMRRKELAPQPQAKKVDEVVEEQKEAVGYSTMNRSDLFKLAKEKDYDRPWISSTSEILIEYLNNA